MEERNDNERNKGVFYVIVAVATLIVAIVGATLAYFSVYAGSNENAVGFQAARVSISYNDGAAIDLPGELIPSTEDVATKSYLEPREADEHGEGGRERCMDDNGRQVCHIYNFSVSNTGDAVGLTMNLKANLNEFTNLRYILYDVTNSNNITNIYASQKVDDPDFNSYELIGSVVSLAGYDSQNDPLTYNMPAGTESDPTTKVFDLVIFLNETDPSLEGDSQDYEQGARFAGTIEVKFGEGQKITGYISD